MFIYKTFPTNQISPHILLKSKTFIFDSLNSLRKILSVYSIKCVESNL